MSFSTVLIVDDNPTDVFLLRHAIEAAGVPADFVCFASGAAALDYVHRSVPPDFIVADFLLTGDTGLDVLSTLPPNLRARTVLLSGMISSRLEKAIGAPEVACFQKPIDLDGWFALGRQLSPFIARRTRVAA